MIISDAEFCDFYQFMICEMSIQNGLNKPVNHDRIPIGFYDISTIFLENNHFNRFPIMIIFFPIYFMHIVEFVCLISLIISQTLIAKCPDHSK